MQRFLSEQAPMPSRSSLVQLRGRHSTAGSKTNVRAVRSALGASSSSGLRFWLRPFAASRRNVVKADEIDVLTGAVLRYLEQVEDAEEARFAGELWRDVGHADGLD